MIQEEIRSTRHIKYKLDTLKPLVSVKAPGFSTLGSSENSLRASGPGWLPWGVECPHDQWGRFLGIHQSVCRGPFSEAPPNKAPPTLPEQDELGPPLVLDFQSQVLHFAQNEKSANAHQITIPVPSGPI